MTAFILLLLFNFVLTMNALPVKKTKIFTSDVVFDIVQLQFRGHFQLPNRVDTALTLHIQYLNGVL